MQPTVPSLDSSLSKLIFHGPLSGKTVLRFSWQVGMFHCETSSGSNLQGKRENATGYPGYQKSHSFSFCYSFSWSSVLIGLPRLCHFI
jgi:hypothetical protein